MPAIVANPSGSVATVNSPDSPPRAGLWHALLAALNVAVLGLTLLLGVPAWAAVAAIAASTGWVVARHYGVAPLAAGMIAAASAFAMAFAAEGVRASLADEPDTHRYFVEGTAAVHIAPDDDSPPTGAVFFPGDEVQVVCIGGPREAWAKLDSGAWVEADELLAEIGADAAPDC